MSDVSRGDSVHPLLVAAAAALDSSGATWTLLRGTDLWQPRGDVDLLIDRDHGRRTRAVLDEPGFMPLREWARGHQRAFIARHRELGAVELHVVDQLSFGPWHEYVLPEAVTAGVLSRRARPATGDTALWRLDPADEAWITLLHVLLDKGAVAPRHRDALRRGAPATGVDAPIATAVAELVGPAMVERIAGCVVKEDWPALEALAEPLRRAWSAADRRARLTALVNRAELTAHKSVEPATRAAIDVALLAPDGAGKSTVARRLSEALPGPVRVRYLGLYGAHDPVTDVAVPGAGFIQRVARTWWRWGGGRIDRWRRRTVVYDRHPLDARLPGGDRSLPGRIRRWLLGRIVPVPALVVVLDAPGVELHARKGEHDAATLEAQRGGYLALAARLPNAVVVDAMQPEQEVVAAVADAVWNAQFAHSRRRRRRRW